MLLAGSLLNGPYVPSSWQPGFSDAFDRFTGRLARARANERANQMEAEDYEYMRQYGHKASANTDSAATIRDRHLFFCSKMLEWMRPKVRDSKRVLGPLEREIAYRRDGKRCQVCGKEVVWNEAEFHHVDPHTEGGPTAIENAALVHRSCHPRSEEEVRRFAERRGMLSRVVSGPQA